MDKVAFKYTELAAISIKQPYYANGKYKNTPLEPILDFDLTPTDECLALMRRLDLVFRSVNRAAGCMILANVHGKNGGGNDLLRIPPKTEDKLTFWITLRNPSALNFSAFPVSGDFGRIYYFSNNQTDAAALRNDLHLSNAASGADNTNDRLSWATVHFSFHHNSEIAQGAAKIKHLLTGAEILPYSVVNQAGQANLLFNLSALSLGKCLLIINGNVASEIYYIGSPAFQPLGVVELSLSASLAANYRITEADRSLALDRPAYSILFQNRKTYWRYTLHLHAASSLSLEMSTLNAAEKADFLSRLNIVSNDATITFSQASATDTDIVFVSDSALALQEKYISGGIAHDLLSLTLKKYIGIVAKEAVIRSDLPCPQTGPIDATVPPYIYSDIFLTL